MRTQTRIRRAHFLWLVVAIVLAASGLTPATKASADAVTDARFAQLTTFTQTNLASLMNKTDAADPRYYAGGVFYDGSATCFRCTLGPGVEAAVFGKTRAWQGYINPAIISFDTAIAQHQLSNGAFAVTTGGTANEIETAMFAAELAETYLVLGTSLDQTRRTKWAASLTRAVDYLAKNGNLTWYTNGNINILETVLMALTAKITGSATYQAYYTQSLDFTVSPSQVLWPGYGLTYTQVPTKSDGSDGSAYFNESASGGIPGFDADYTQMQLDATSWWYLLTGDPAALRLTNLLFNQLMMRVNTTKWTLDTSGGTRHPEAVRTIGFFSSALAVLALRGGRTDLAGYVDSQLAATMTGYKNLLSIVNPAGSYGFGSQFAPALLVTSPL
jgi:hypothetical protein